MNFVCASAPPAAGLLTASTKPGIRIVMRPMRRPTASLPVLLPLFFIVGQGQRGSLLEEREGATAGGPPCWKQEGQLQVCPPEACAAERLSIRHQVVCLLPEAAVAWKQRRVWELLLQPLHKRSATSAQLNQLCTNHPPPKTEEPCLHSRLQPLLGQSPAMR